MNARMVGVISECRYQGPLTEGSDALFVDKMPGINNLVGMIKSRRRRDSIILGLLIGVCTIIILSYIWN
jgi:hypothetical protein